MKNLEIKWTISKARDTYGYNVVTLLDRSTKYKTCGGGYDMLGTVFAQWLWANHREEIIVKLKDRLTDFYGLFYRGEKYYLDGACGLECIIAIAKEIGLKVQRLYSRNTTTNFIVEG